jgi:hypothetical protein
VILKKLVVHTQMPEFSVGGFFLLLLLTLIIGAMITGAWPLMLGMAHTVDALLALLKKSKLKTLAEIGEAGDNDEETINQFQTLNKAV